MSNCKACADAARRLSDENWELKQVMLRCLESMYEAGADYKWLQTYMEAKCPEVFPKGHVKMSDL